MESLFVTAKTEAVDSNYLISILQPNFATDVSTKKRLEETFVDYLQDLTNNIEESKVTGISGEVIADGESEDELIADLTVSGLLG